MYQRRPIGFSFNRRTSYLAGIDIRQLFFFAWTYFVKYKVWVYVCQSTFCLSLFTIL